MFGHILIPIDGSQLSMGAMKTALAFAREAGAKVTVLTVTEPFHVFSASPEQLELTRDEYEQHAAAQAAGALAAAEAEARTQGVSCDIVRMSGDTPYLAIIETATQRGCDLIAMASHGRTGIAAVVLGSVTVKVLTHSKIPVLVYR